MEYDSISPVTGNKTVVEEQIGDDVYKVCMETGYATYRDAWKDPEILEKVILTMPDYVVDACIIDDTGGHWFPVLIIGHENVLYPIKTDDKILWAVVNLIELQEDESIEGLQLIKLPNENEQLVDFKLDVDNAKIFQLSQFSQAMNEFYSNQNNE